MNCNLIFTDITTILLRVEERALLLLMDLNDDVVAVEYEGFGLNRNRGLKNPFSASEIMLELESTPLSSSQSKLALFE